VVGGITAARLRLAAPEVLPQSRTEPRVAGRLLLPLAVIGHGPVRRRFARNVAGGFGRRKPRGAGTQRLANRAKALFGRALRPLFRYGKHRRLGLSRCAIQSSPARALL
jgi:hypothetical protein